MQTHDEEMFCLLEHLSCKDHDGIGSIAHLEKSRCKYD